MSDGKIEKVQQRTGQRGRPNNVEIRGGTTDRSGVQIVGAAPLAGPTEILDRTKGGQTPPPEVHTHEERVLERPAQIRSAPRNPDIEIRARSMTPEAREAWNAAKEGKD